MSSCKKKKELTGAIMTRKLQNKILTKQNIYNKIMPVHILK